MDLAAPLVSMTTQVTSVKVLIMRLRLFHTLGVIS